MAEEFEEIGHSGGRITFIINTDNEGRLSYQVQFVHDRPVPVVMIDIWALPLVYQSHLSNSAKQVRRCQDAFQYP